MTVVHVVLKVPQPDGELGPAAGALTFTPTHRRAITGTPDVTVLPLPFKAKLVSGAVDVVLAPTPGDMAWVWRCDEHVYGQPTRTIYTAVPDVVEVDYPDLVPLDPATLAPAPGTAPSWAGPLAELDTRLSAGVVTPDPENPGFYLIGA